MEQKWEWVASWVLHASLREGSLLHHISITSSLTQQNLIGLRQFWFQSFNQSIMRWESIFERVQKGSVQYNSDRRVNKYEGVSRWEYMPLIPPYPGVKWRLNHSTHGSHTPYRGGWEPYTEKIYGGKISTDSVQHTIFFEVALDREVLWSLQEKLCETETPGKLREVEKFSVYRWRRVG